MTSCSDQYSSSSVPAIPRLAADARIFAGAVVTGPVLVGDNVVIGANTVVSRDVPDRTVVRPAEPSLSPLPAAFIVSPPAA